MDPFLCLVSEKSAGKCKKRRHSLSTLEIMYRAIIALSYQPHENFLALKKLWFWLSCLRFYKSLQDCLAPTTRRTVGKKRHTRNVLARSHSKACLPDPQSPSSSKSFSPPLPPLKKLQRSIHAASPVYGEILFCRLEWGIVLRPKLRLHSRAAHFCVFRAHVSIQNVNGERAEASLMFV